MSPPWTLNEGLRRRRPRRKLWANLEVIESGYSTLFAKQPALTRQQVRLLPLPPWHKVSLSIN